MTVAKAHGAVACLELPYNVDDLIDILDRTTRLLSINRVPVPARTEQPHRLPPPPRRRQGRRADPAWSDRAEKPKVGNG